jgi:rubredoxin
MSTHKSVLTALAVFLISGLGVPSPALAGPGGGCGGGGCEGPKAPEPAPVAGAKAPKGLLVDLGNERCPIMGGKVDGASFSEWNGLRIGHCCPDCGEEIERNGAAALDRAKVAWREAAEAVKKVNEATGEARTKALAELRAKWKVVREPAPETPKGILVDLGNERCPVMGGKVDGETFSEWEGLRIGHCCPGCTAALAKDPAAVLDRAKVDWREAAGAVKRVNEATGEARTKALAELRAKWKVVREPAPEAPPAAPAK